MRQVKGRTQFQPMPRLLIEGQTKIRKRAGKQVVVDLIFSVFLLAQVQSLLGKFLLP
jgi:hypothetical protein